MPSTGPISIRPSSVLLAASTTRAGRAQPVPGRRVEVVRLRVVVRVGQQRVVVVRQVHLAEPLVGQEQPERREDQRVVQPLVAERVAVDRLVLQRGVLRQQEREQRHREPEAERAGMSGDGAPRAA